MTGQRNTKAEVTLRRRVFLGALGLGLSAPLATRMARRAVALAATATRPRRLMIVYIPHGMPDEHFTPTGSDGNLNLGPSPISVLSPLEPYKSYVTSVQGLTMNAGATNHAAIRAVLTGFPEGAGSDSIDALIAAKLGLSAYAMGTVPYSAGGGFYSDDFLLKQGTWVRPEPDPGKSATALFGVAAGSEISPAPSPAAASEAAFRAEMLTLTEGEIASAQKLLSGLTSEQNKLQIHLDAVRSLRAMGPGAAGGIRMLTCMGRPNLPLVDAIVGKDPLDPANLAGVLDANLEVAAAALACGAASVISLQNMYTNAGIAMNFAGGPGIAKAHHDPISHSWDDTGRAEFATCQRWFYQHLVTSLVKTLAETPDAADTTAPGRTVLDNTLIMVCSEISDGAEHNSDASPVYVDSKPIDTSLPFVLIGGASGYLKTGGRIVNAKTVHTDLLASLAEAMGAPLSTIGGQAVHPIAELKA
ncbi:MAG TPA: DUF1552 domain-containing protein [Polyangia bacterium]|jgi:hypothetical protein|nr:DUF1552 domain-containing protein [Polyangia bacterium]